MTRRMGMSVWWRWVLAPLVLILLNISTVAGAKEQKLGVPDTILRGMGDYAFQGAEAAVKAWTKGSTLEGSPEALIQVNSLKQVESLYGKFLNHHIIQVHEMTPSTLIVYLSINYERGPLFARFIAYRLKDSWILPEFSFHIRPEAVFPPSLLAD